MTDSDKKQQLDDLERRDDQMWMFLSRGAMAGMTAGLLSSGALFAGQRYCTLTRVTFFVSFFPIASILQSLTPQAKLATILTIGLGTSVISAEHAIYRFHRPQMAQDVREHRSAMSWPEYLFEYRHPIFAGTFAAAVLGGIAAYSGDRYKSGTQKFLNIRLYGQGLALMALFGTIGLGSLVSQHQDKMAELDRKRAMERITKASKDDEMLLPKSKNGHK